MIRVKEAILVEGRYDKNTLSQVVDAAIFESEGFGIFKNKEKMKFLRKIAESRGLIVFTDSDGAGFVIRNHMKSAIPSQFLKHAYIPDVYGKERRKSAPGKEGLLGVEGMTPQVLIDALHRAGATFENESERMTGCITKQDLMQLGLSGGKNSAHLRQQLITYLDFPRHMSANALLDALNLLYTVEELAGIVKKLESNNG